MRNGKGGRRCVVGEGRGREMRLGGLLDLDPCVAGWI